MKRNENLVINRNKATGMMSLPFLMTLMMIHIPILFMIRISFYEPSNIYAYGTGFTLNNYTELLSDPFYQEVLLRTLIIGLGTGIISVLVAYPVAFHMSRMSPKGQRILTLIITAPLYTTIVIRCYAWMVILGQNGIINSTLGMFGTEPLELMYNYGAVFLGLLYVNLPFMTLSIYNVLMGIDRSVEEASAVMGASPWHTFREVIFPLSLQGIFAGFFLVFVMSMGSYIVPQYLGGSRMGLIPNYIYILIMQSFNWTSGAALAFTYFIIVFVVLMIYFKIMAWFSRYLEGGTVSR